MRPSQNEERYYCRKGNHARNVQLITDADFNILHVDATYGGATHHSFIFNNCVIQPKLDSLVEAGETIHLLGDSGYAQRTYLMVPIPNAFEGSPEEHHNKLHATAHNTEERAIGRQKGRFRCLLVHRLLHYDPEIVATIPYNTVYGFLLQLWASMTYKKKFVFTQQYVHEALVMMVYPEKLFRGNQVDKTY